MSGNREHSNLPPEQMTARHLNPDFVPRARYDALLAENQRLREALRAVWNVAMTADEGDPWYCEEAGIDVKGAYALAREALRAAR